jgi:hypothetical protein
MVDIRPGNRNNSHTLPVDPLGTAHKRRHSMLNLNPMEHSLNDNGEGKEPVESLKELLSAEHTSVNNFKHCLETLAAAGLHTVSMACLDIHAVNVQLLSDRLAELGVEERKSTDLWHSFLELISTTTSMFGEEAILNELRKHEMALYNEYQARLDKFDGENQLLMQETLIPNQVKVLELLGAMTTGAAEGVIKPGMPLNLNWA